MWQPIRDHVGAGLGPAEWLAAKERLPVGARVVGEVLACLPMGFWMALGDGLVGQVETPKIVDGPGPVGVDAWPLVGSSVAALVLDHRDDGHHVRLSARPSDVFEQVHVEHNRYDGPLTGIANVEGTPHYFSRVWDSEADDWEVATFAVWPLESEVFDLEVESWNIFVAWNDSFEAGQAQSDTHPGVDGVDARFGELERLLAEGRVAPDGARRRLAHWDPIDRTRRYVETGPDYRVAWIADTS